MWNFSHQNLHLLFIYSYLCVLVNKIYKYNIIKFIIDIDLHLNEVSVSTVE